MKILVIDNYDSFTYNLVHYLQEIHDGPIEVLRNDAVDVVAAARFDAILFSPGPGIPEEAGNMPAIIKALAGKVPMLGVCLGHQAIGESFGGTLVNLEKVYHGVMTAVQVVNEAHEIFDGVPATFDAGRYHSWVVSKDNFPEVLEVTAVSPDGAVMALRHKQFPIHGVQFHPESIMTAEGKRILGNFLKDAARFHSKNNNQ